MEMAGQAPGTLRENLGQSAEYPVRIGQISCTNWSDALHESS